MSHFRMTEIMVDAIFTIKYQFLPILIEEQKARAKAYHLTGERRNAIAVDPELIKMHKEIEETEMLVAQLERVLAEQNVFANNMDLLLETSEIINYLQDILDRLDKIIGHTTNTASIKHLFLEKGFTFKERYQTLGDADSELQHIILKLPPMISGLYSVDSGIANKLTTVLSTLMEANNIGNINNHISATADGRINDGKDVEKLRTFFATIAKTRPSIAAALAALRNRTVSSPIP